MQTHTEVRVNEYTDNAIQHHGVLESGTAFIEKPFTPASLTKKIRDILDGVEEG